MEYDYYLWLCFTDKGIIYFNGKQSLKEVEYILRQYHKCKDFEIHLIDSDTYLFFLKNYLEDCLQLEYVKEI